MQPHRPQTEGQPCPNCGRIHAGAPTVAAAQKVGEDAPEVKLPDLEGKTVELADFRGEKTLLVFWNPGCGFCQQMLLELTRIIHERLRRLPRGCAIDFVPDAPRPDVDGLSSGAL
jgi:thiol-disulfide isomerase/thioredoxin